MGTECCYSVDKILSFLVPTAFQEIESYNCVGFHGQSLDCHGFPGIAGKPRQSKLKVNTYRLRHEERMNFTGKNVLKLHQIKLLLISSNSQVNAVYLGIQHPSYDVLPYWYRSWDVSWNSSSLSRSYLVLSAEFLPETLTASTFNRSTNGIWPSRRDFSSMLILCRVLNPPTSKSCSD